MHPWRLTTIVGAVFTGLALPFPFATMPALGAIDGISGAAWPAAIPVALVLLIAVLGRRSRGLRPLGVVAAVLIGATALLFASLKLTDAVLAVRATPGASLGPGGFVLLLGTAVALVGCSLAAMRD